MSGANDDSAHILALEPWFGGSHQQFLEQWRENSQQRVEILGLPPRHWRWRMRSSAWQFARSLAQRDLPDALWVSDYVELPTLLGHLPPAWSSLRVVAYFHENQATYPQSPSATSVELERDNHLAWSNLSTALRADLVLFNSEFHRAEFRRGFEQLLRIWPKPNPKLEFEAMLAKSQVVSPGVRLDQFPIGPGAPEGSPLRVLYNQRWEHDKDPAAMLEAVLGALERGAQLELMLLGERFDELPPRVPELLSRLSVVTLESEFVSDRSSYAAALRACDLVLSTSKHEFFGMAVVEALAAGCTPLLPNRLSYPEIIPSEQHATVLYDGPLQLVQRLCEHARQPAPLRLAHTVRAGWRRVAERHSALQVAKELDAACLGD